MVATGFDHRWPFPFHVRRPPSEPLLAAAPTAVLGSPPAAASVAAHALSSSKRVRRCSVKVASSDHGWSNLMFSSHGVYTIEDETTYGFSSCIMDRIGFIVPRLVISVIIQLLSGYSTLPLYAIVTQMGSSFKRAIFEEHVGEKLVAWADKVKNRVKRREIPEESLANGSSKGIRMLAPLFRKPEPTELKEIERSS